MAAFVATSVQTYIGRLDVTSLTKSVTFGPVSVSMQDSTTHADGGYTCVLPGLVSGEVGVELMQDQAAGSLDATLAGPTALSSRYPITVAANPTGTATAGDSCWLTRGVADQYAPLRGAVGEIGMAALHFGTDTAPLLGKLAHPKAARTTSGTGTAVALTGPSASQNIYAALHVFAFSGLTNIVVKVQSDDNSGFTSATDRITFSTVTGITEEWKSLAGDLSTETYWRVSWTVTGTGSCTFAASFGVA